MAEVLATAGVAIAALMLTTWVISGIVGNASIVDLMWGLGFVLVAWTVYLRFGPEPGADSSNRLGPLLPTILTTLWGLRLSAYLTWRNAGKGEDFRYRAMREKQGTRFFAVSLLSVFGLQGLLMWVVSLPVQASVSRPAATAGFRWLAISGTVLWSIGFLFETIGDLQLARFRAASETGNTVMDRGLWRYTRHPNYFGDCCVWWGLYLFALDAGHWWTIAGPAVMTALLTRYSGAGLLEKTIVDRRPGYREYMDKTSPFVPLPPRA